MFFQQFFVFSLLWLISQNSPGVKIRSGRSIALSWTKTCANDLLHKVLAKACLPLSLSPAVSAILPLNSPFSALCSLLSSTCFLFFFSFVSSTYWFSISLFRFPLPRLAFGFGFGFGLLCWLLPLLFAIFLRISHCKLTYLICHRCPRVSARMCVWMCVCVASELHELKFCTHKICNSLFALPKRIQRFGQRLLLLDFGKSALPKKCQG